MTISVQTPLNQYTGNGSTVVFTYTFLIDEATDLQVYLGSTLKILTTDYTVSGVGVNSGGTITFGTAPAAGVVVTLTRDMPLARTVNYQPNGAFDAADVNTDFDRLWMKAQEVNTTLGLAVQANPFDTPASLSLPLVAVRAGKALGFDSSGNLIASASLGTWRGTWTTATSYNVSDIVIDGSNGANTGNYYYCVGTNTSGTWSTDLSAGDWVLAFNVAGLVASASAAATAIAAGLTDTSTSSNAVGTGSKTFTVSTGKQFQAGQFVLVTDQASATNYMHGQVTSYSGSSLVIDVEDTGGGGTKTAWNISISGSQGSTGSQGPTGPAGGTFIENSISTNQSLGLGQTLNWYIASTALTLTLAHSTGLTTGWQNIAEAQGGAITVALANSGDKINGGTAGAGITIPQGNYATLVTDAAGNFYITVSPSITNRQVPAGGSTGQVLEKNSNSDYDIGWASVVTGLGLVAIQNFDSSGTYTPNAAMKFAIAIGTGGGGGGSIEGTSFPGGNGGTTSIGSLLSAAGGSGASVLGGAGGSTGTGVFIVAGSDGGSGGYLIGIAVPCVGTTYFQDGAPGGGSWWGPGAPGYGLQDTGNNGKSATVPGGGGGGGSFNTYGDAPMSGGGGGATAFALLTASGVGASKSVTIGAGGTGGASPDSGAGFKGKVVIFEFG